MKWSLGILILMTVALVACQGTVTDGQQPAEGRAVFVITDAAADMEAVSEVRITVESVLVHSAASGWVEVSSEAETYNLLELEEEARTALLADVNLSEGTYDQARLVVSEVVVIDADGEHDARLPSDELRMQSRFTVSEGSVSAAEFDFIVDESLHVTGTGEYVLAPVVHITTRENAEVEIEGRSRSESRVAIRGGQTLTDVRIGMGADGNMAADVRLPADANVDVDALGNIQVGSGSRAEVNTSAGVDADAGVGVDADVGGGLY